MNYRQRFKPIDEANGLPPHKRQDRECRMFSACSGEKPGLGPARPFPDSYSPNAEVFVQSF
jgi:hypothetical protein